MKGKNRPMSDMRRWMMGHLPMARVLAIWVGVSLGAVWGAEVLKLPDGSWIGPPVMVEAKPDRSRVTSPFDTYRSAQPRFRAEIREDKTLLRQLFEVLPTALQKKMKTPPPAPTSGFFDMPVDRVLVFSTGGGWPLSTSRYDYALADKDGNIGEGISNGWNRAVGSLLIVPAVVPRLSPEVTFLAWERAKGADKPDFTKPPVAKMVFRNPLYSESPVPPLWPDGKSEIEMKWRGRTLRLEKAVRSLHDVELGDRKKISAGVDFDFVLEGSRTAKDLGDVEWFLEDNRGNFLQTTSTRSGWSSNQATVSLSYSSSSVAFWPENLNWRLTLVLRPSNLAVMEEKEYRRIRIQHPKGRVEEKVVEAAFEINGVSFKNLRISADPKPREFDQPEIAQWYVPAVIEFEVENAPPGVFIEFSHFYDGFLPFTDRPHGVGKPRHDYRRNNEHLGRFPVALDRQADFLEFVISVTREERLEFYFQPELLP